MKVRGFLSEIRRPFKKSSWKSLVEKARGFLIDVRHSFKRPSRKTLLKATLPILGCLALAVAMSLFLQNIVDDPEHFADEFADKYGNYVYVAIFFICFFRSLHTLLPAPGPLVIFALVPLPHL